MSLFIVFLNTLMAIILETTKEPNNNTLYIYIYIYIHTFLCKHGNTLTTKKSTLDFLRRYYEMVKNYCALKAHFSFFFIYVHNCLFIVFIYLAPLN